MDKLSSTLSMHLDFSKKNEVEGVLVIPDSKLAGGTPHITKLVLLLANGKQLTFIGAINGAPIMVTFYPKQKIIIYSQQSHWGQYIEDGVRANFMYAHCELSTE